LNYVELISKPIETLAVSRLEASVNSQG